MRDTAAERPDDRRVIAACVFEEGHEQQGARVVVQAVASLVARMLKMAC